MVVQYEVLVGWREARARSLAVVMQLPLLFVSKRFGKVGNLATLGFCGIDGRNGLDGNRSFKLSREVAPVV